MKRIIGISLLGVGVLMVLVGGVWSFQQGLWSLAQDGPAVGLARVFFLVLFLPMILLLSVGGLILWRPEWLVTSQLVQKVFGIGSLFSVLAAFLFVGSNLMWSIKYYGEYYKGIDMGGVLFINLLFALPLLLLGGLLFRAARRDKG